MSGNLIIPIPGCLGISKGDVIYGVLRVLELSLGTNLKRPGGTNAGSLENHVLFIVPYTYLSHPESQFGAVWDAPSYII